MQTFKCEICKNILDLENAVGGKPTSQNTNYRRLNKTSRCKPCNNYLAREWRKNNPGYRGSGKLKAIPQEDRLLVSAIGSRLTDAKGRASKYGCPIDLDKDYLYQLFIEQNRKCALSGVALRVEKNAVACLSLDKVDPSKGYLKGNVQWVAWAVNRAKGDMPTDVFVDMCLKVVEYMKVQRLSKSSES